MELQQAFSAYLAAPGGASARALQESVRAVPDFSAETEWLDRAESLSEADRHDEVVRLIRACFPGALFCPTAHRLLAQALAGLGQTEAARREAHHGLVALEAIAHTGDGTRERPWHVLHVVDEYEFLAYRGLSPQGQAVHAGGPGVLKDVLTGPDGREYWFLVPEPERAL